MKEKERARERRRERARGKGEILGRSWQHKQLDMFVLFVWFMPEVSIMPEVLIYTSGISCSGRQWPDWPYDTNYNRIEDGAVRSK